MSKIINTGSKGKSRRLHKRSIVMAAVIFLVVIVSVVLFVSPNLRTTISDKVGVLLDPASGVCSDNKKLMTEYNTVSKSADKDAFTKFIGKVKTLPGAGDDATCGYIIFHYEATYGTIAAAKAQLSTLRALEKDNKKISRFVDDGIDRNKLYQAVDGLQEGSSEVDG